jgi:hypothetical protein
VAAAGGIEALMMLLSDKDRHVKAKAAGALQSLAVDEDNQKKIKSLGAIPLITKLLSSRTPEVFAPVLTPVQGCLARRCLEPLLLRGMRPPCVYACSLRQASLIYTP